MIVPSSETKTNVNVKAGVSPQVIEQNNCYEVFSFQWEEHFSRSEIAEELKRFSCKKNAAATVTEVKIYHFCCCFSRSESSSSQLLLRWWWRTRLVLNSSIDSSFFVPEWNASSWIMRSITSTEFWISNWWELNIRVLQPVEQEETSECYRIVSYFDLKININIIGTKKHNWKEKKII